MYTITKRLNLWHNWIQQHNLGAVKLKAPSHTLHVGSIFTSVVVAVLEVKIAGKDIERDQMEPLCLEHSILSFDATLSLSMEKNK